MFRDYYLIGSKEDDKSFTFQEQTLLLIRDLQDRVIALEQKVRRLGGESSRPIYLDPLFRGQESGEDL